ncbi:hypothetical protein L3Q82_001466 [Scortum barcoo]|uniref:Uncharacterized protein n=1 Tax=Scortum barcoo TaxID=214431 RepID=A0ACB8W8A5_9TELE|nr:hypothetical protein L3Q82_001466 [Scortum barcoo]
MERPSGNNGGVWDRGVEPSWWRLIVVSVGLSGLLISVVAVNIWTKIKDNRAQTDENMCRHTVKWLYEGKDVDKDNKDLQTSQTGCYTTVSFLTSHHIYTSRLNLFTCEVTDGHTGKVQLFPFSLQSSGEDSIRATTKPTTTTSEKIKTGTTTTASAINDASTELRGDTQTPTTKPTTTPEHSTAGTTTTGANEPLNNLQAWLRVIIVSLGFNSTHNNCCGSQHLDKN